MNCEVVIKEIFESPLGQTSVSVQKHIEECESCQQEYLNLQRLENSFLHQGLDRERYRGLSLKGRGAVLAAVGVSCFLFFFGPVNLDQGKNGLTTQTQSVAYKGWSEEFQVALAQSTQSELSAGFDLPGSSELGDLQFDEYLEDEAPEIPSMEIMEIDVSDYFEEALEEATQSVQETDFWIEDQLGRG